MKKLMLFAAALLFSFAAVNAQDPNPKEVKGERPQPQRVKPKDRARANADTLNALVQLDEKQYKKVYKIFLEEANSIYDLFPNRSGGGRPPMGGGRPGGFSGGGGRAPMGGYNGGGGMGGSMGGYGGGRPPMNGQMKSFPEKIKEIQEKREKKLKKTLTEEQYKIYEESEFKKGLSRGFGRGPRKGQAPEPVQM
ncbi:MAG: hypothetical protein J6Z32_06455 [Bacteroidales bacterium]|nr:hypothetical protein [Bacteroidales bacterium]